MDNKALFESVMLDDEDSALLTADLSKITAMIDRAAQAIDGIEAAGAPKPDASWQITVPASDPAVFANGADVVAARHEIACDGLTVSGETMTVPRVVA